ncbi:MAG: LytTR family transcriptional regulator [Bacteroidales bacterium]|nr:LytTR family transcriptional regulator [Bacteroidales bacterium]
MKKDKAFWRILTHLLFWVFFFYIFVMLNFFRPYPFYHPYKEWIIGIVIMAACYATYFWTVPRFYLNGFTIKFFIVSFVGCLLLTAFEMGFLWNDIMPIAKRRPSLLTVYLLQMFVMILLRDCCLVGFFFILRTNHHYSMELRRVNTQLVQESALFSINIGKGNSVTVPLSDIVYIRHQKNYSYFYLVDGKSLCQYISLSKIEEDMPSDLFSRINKSVLVNKRHIESINLEKLTITTSLTDPKTGKAVMLNISPVYGNLANFHK